MSIVNSAATFFIDSGELYQRTGVSISGTTTTTVPASGSFSPAISRGLARAKFSSGGGTSPTFVNLNITGTDGTSTVTLDDFVPVAAIALSSNILVDYLADFITDLSLTSISFVLTMGGTSPTCTGDFEVVGTP